jgi:sec-independent protein translocase protein TatC
MTPAAPADPPGAAASPADALPTDPEAAMPRMTLVEHLNELRWRLVKCALAMLVTMGLSFWFYKDITAFVFEPYRAAAEAQGLSTKLSAVDPGEGFVTMMKLCFLTGFVAAAPLLLWQMWQFVAAGLYDNEKRAVRIFFPFGLGLFALGLVVAYRVLIPVGIGWLLDFSAKDMGLNTEFRVQTYTSLCLSLVFGMGIAFQLPLVIMFLQGSGLVQRKTFLRYWRHAIVGSFVVGMVLTADPSPVTQTLMALPLCGLYFLGVWGGRFVGAHKERFSWWKAWPLILGLLVFAALLIWGNRLSSLWK